MKLVIIFDASKYGKNLSNRNIAGTKKLFHDYRSKNSRICQKKQFSGNGNSGLESSSNIKVKIRRRIIISFEKFPIAVM